jgi:uncharacterized protein (TIGR00725 family)
VSDLHIAVVGPGKPSAGEYETAQEVGAALAEQGVVVVCGGLGGVMEAACRGAKAAGGATVGILPGTREEDANEWVDLPLPTGLGEARNAIIVRVAAGVVAIGGGYGTLSEIAFALRAAKPVVGIGTWEIARGGEPDTAIVRATDAREAVALVVRAAASSTRA